MAALFHAPVWLWWLLIGLVVATALVLIYDRWPTWIRAVAFIFTVMAWPITLVGWVCYGAVLKNPR